MWNRALGSLEVVIVGTIDELIRWPILVSTTLSSIAAETGLALGATTEIESSSAFFTSPPSCSTIKMDGMFFLEVRIVVRDS